MAPLSRDRLLSYLTEAGVDFTEHHHAAAMTADAQAALLTHVPGVVTKNLFLKDKKHRLCVITALATTKIDLKVLGARMGVGKNNLSMASEELVRSVLQVPLGSVTPLALANPSALEVLLLLDARIKDQVAIFVHPLVNTSSLALSPSAFDAALSAVGREPVYVELEVEPKIDKENPPDLKHLADDTDPHPLAVPAEAAAASGATATPAAAPASQTPAAGAPCNAAAAAAAAAPSTSPSSSDSVKGSATAATTGKASAKASAKAQKQAASGGGSSSGGSSAQAVVVVGGGCSNSSAAVLQRLTDVSARTEEVLKMVSGVLLGKAVDEAELEPYILTRLRADLATTLNALKNAAYSSGYVAGKGEIVAFAQKLYA
ncbi:MAG: hypothetical protein WDW38_001620 [Sanguina aurantia]